MENIITDVVEIKISAPSIAELDELKNKIEDAITEINNTSNSRVEII